MKAFSLCSFVFFHLSSVHFHVFGHQIVNRNALHPFGVIDGDCQLCPNSNVYCSGCQYCPDGSLCANANCGKPDPPGPNECKNAWDFSLLSGNLNTCSHFKNADSSITIEACGYGLYNEPLSLYGHGSGSSSLGLGLNHPDGSHNNGIDTAGFVQLDLHEVFSANQNSVNGRFMMSSSSSNSQWILYGSNEKGLLGTFLLSGTDLLQLEQIPRYGRYRYLSFTAGSGDVLLYFFYSNCAIDSPVPSPVATPVRLPTSAPIQHGPGSCATTWDFSEIGGPLTPCQVYDPSNGHAIISACGYDLAGTQIDLYGKSAGDDEVGLGVSTDPTGNHEIWTDGFIQFDLVAVLAIQPTPSNARITFSSVTGPETWKMYGSAHPGSIGRLLAVGNTEDYVLIPAFGTYRYLNVIAQGGNFLVQKIQIDCPITIAPSSAPSRAPVTVRPTVPQSHAPTNTGDCTHPRSWHFLDTYGDVGHTYSWKSDQDGDKSPLISYAFAVDGQAADLSALSKGGLGVIDSGAANGFQITTGYYVSFNVRPWTSEGQSLVFQIGGFGEFAVYGSESTGGPLSNYVLLYHGAPGKYTLHTQAYKYIAISAYSGMVRIHGVKLMCAQVRHTKKPTVLPTRRPSRQPIASSVPSISNAPIWVSDSPALSYMPTPAGLCDHTWDFQDLQGSLGFTATFSATDNLQVTAYAYLNNGSKADLFANSLGLGIFNPYSSFGHHITSTNNLEFDISDFTSTIIEIDYQGFGNLLVYGSNESGFGVDAPVQTLLYDGSPRPFSCAYCTNKFIKATMAFGLAHVTEFHVRTPCVSGEPSTAPVASPSSPSSAPLYLAPAQLASDSPALAPWASSKCRHNWSFNGTFSDFHGHSNQYPSDDPSDRRYVSINGYGSDGSSAELISSGHGVGIWGTTNRTIDAQHYLEIDVRAFQNAPVTINTVAFPGSSADVVIFGSSQSGGSLDSVGKVLLYKGPAGEFGFNCQYKYISVSCGRNERILLHHINVGCIDNNGVTPPLTSSSSSFSGALSYQNTIIVAVICSFMCILCICVAAHCYMHRKKEENFASPRSDVCDLNNVFCPTEKIEGDRDSAIINPAREERGRSGSWFADNRSRARTQSWAELFSPVFSAGSANSRRNMSPRAQSSGRNRGESMADVIGMSPRSVESDR